MKKTSAKIITVLLLLSMTLGLFACADNSGKKEENTTAPDETKETIAWLDNLPADLNFNGRTVRSVGGTFGSTMTADDTKEVVSKAFYDRYLNVTERLNLTVNEQVMDGLTSQYDMIRAIVEGGLSEYDLVMGCGLNSVALALDGYLLDMAKEPDFSLIDLDAVYWATEFTNELNIADYKFWVFGEASRELEDQFYTMFVNNDLLCTLVGEEKTPIYDIVRSGEWTLDKLNEFVELAYIDDGDGERNSNDTYGFMQQGDTFIDVIAYCAGATYSKRDEDNVPVSNLNTENNVTINEKLYDLVHLDGALKHEEGGSFKKGNVLFYAECSDVTGGLREMVDDWTMIPMPKLNEDMENYKTTVHNTFRPYGIPKTASGDANEAVFAMLEAFAAEEHRICRPAYFDEALKNKYSRDEDTKEMVDLASLNVGYDFLRAYGSSTGIDVLFFNSCFQTRDISSAIARKDKPVNKTIDKLLENIENNVD